MTSAPLLQVTDLTKSYPGPIGRRTVIRGLSFTLGPGINVGLIGGNGAGKSTLMRLVSGIEVAESGRVRSRGRISWPIGLTGGLQGSLSGRDNARFVCRIHAEGGSATRELLAWIQEFSGIGRAFDLPVKGYSSGMRSRLTFAMAMAFDFDLYLIDEVTAVGDASFRVRSRQALEARLANSQLIYTSHNMDEVARLCNRVLLLQADAPPQWFDDVRAGIKAYQRLGRPAAT